MPACPNCGSTDPGPGPFCIVCGARLAPPTATAAAATPALDRELPTAGPLNATDPTHVASSSPTPFTPASTSFDRPVAEGEARVPMNIWGPFAGYGQRGRHVSWLINNQGDAAEKLRDVVAERIRRREVPGSLVQPAVLIRQGLLADIRNYFLIRRGLTTAGLYINRFGKDLYVSQVTYFKGPLSTLRMIILGVSVAFALFYPLFLQSASDNVSMNLLGGSVGGLESLAFGLCCVGPVYFINWIALGVFSVYSLYKWVTDKDILAGLRVAPNEFDIDDTVALEKSVEQSVRESLDSVGIEERLMPQATERSFQRTRLI